MGANNGGAQIPADLKRNPARYNGDHIVQQDCKGRAVMLYLPYEQAVAIKNLLFDFHNEIDPINKRVQPADPRQAFFGYPIKEMEPVHQQAYGTLHNALLSTETAAKDEQVG